MKPVSKMETELQSEKARRVLDWEKLALALAIIVIFFVTLIVSFSLINRDVMLDNPAVSPRKYPNPELKAL